MLLLGILGHMLEQGGGHVVVISSLQGKMGLPFRSSCKHSVNGLYSSTEFIIPAIARTAFACDCAYYGNIYRELQFFAFMLSCVGLNADFLE